MPRFDRGSSGFLNENVAICNHVKKYTVLGKGDTKYIPLVRDFSNPGICL